MGSPTTCCLPAPRPLPARHPQLDCQRRLLLQDHQLTAPDGPCALEVAWHRTLIDTGLQTVHQPVMPSSSSARWSTVTGHDVRTCSWTCLWPIVSETRQPLMPESRSDVCLSPTGRGAVLVAPSVLASRERTGAQKLKTGDEASPRRHTVGLQTGAPTACCLPAPRPLPARHSQLDCQRRLLLQGHLERQQRVQPSRPLTRLQGGLYLYVTGHFGDASVADVRLVSGVCFSPTAPSTP